jgi:putative peptidoglycan lipid II flippase
MRAPFIRHVISTFGITILQQFVGLARQILIAAIFGLSRGYDQYLVVYAVATMVVFNTASVFDTVAVSRLVRIRENLGRDAFWRSSNRLLLQAILGGLLFAVGLVALVHLLLPIIAAGFTADERASVAELTVYFVPWILVIVPYYAMSAHLKALWDFHWVFGAETVAMVVSIFVLSLWHDSAICLPIAYGSGYFVALVMLFLRRGIVRSKAVAAPAGLLGGMANQHLANQIGVAAGLVDRYFQSFLAIGGISALGYTGQIVNNLSSLMTLREIYVVPLSSEIGRDEKLQRMLQGIVLVSIPCTFFIAEFATPLVAVLFQRGQFTPEAAILTGDILRISAFSLVITSLLAPMARLFQILNRISYTHALYLVSLVCTAAFQYLLVFRLGWDVYGIAWATLANSAVVTLVVAGLIRRCGVVVDWYRVLGHALLAVAVSVAAVAVSWLGTARFAGLPALVVGSALFGLVVAGCYFLVRRRLRLIIG